MIRFLRFSDAGFAEDFREISERGETTPPGVLETVQEILNDVRKRGDAALCEYTERFDRLKLDPATLEVSADEIAQALAAVDSKTLATLQMAADRIAVFHAKQKEETWLSDDEPDIRLGQMVTPLDRVGIYVPGGKAAYPSSVLMNAVPAKVAGVGEIIMVVPMPDGVVNPYVIAAAHVAGVDRIFKLGGAQAV
ncbi:MAG: histidinol dehydrogenase, partial [Planctomycetales bacterium]